MPGRPKKRAREKARELEAKMATTRTPPAVVAEAPARLGPADGKEMGKAGGNPATALDGEILPPEPEPTRTALKRAMRQAAQKHAEEALEVLAQALKSPDERIRVNAANDILDRAYGKPTPELDGGDGGLLVSIIKFGEGSLN